jgi:hypothetical protein
MLASTSTDTNTNDFDFIFSLLGNLVGRKYRLAGYSMIEKNHLLRVSLKKNPIEIFGYSLPALIIRN